MKLGSVTVLSLSLIFAFSSLAAQDASVASASDVNQCVKWMKATVSARVPDPTEFCSGIWDGHLGGWDSVFKCGEPTQQPTGRAPRYCASSGQISAGEAWVAGFRSATRYGSDLFGGTPDAAKDSQQATVTFYSRTAVWMGRLRVPAGMYNLIPSKSLDGWSLGVAKQDGEWNDAKPAQQYLGSVELKVASDNPPEKRNLAISLSPEAERCPRLSVQRGVKELHFTYGGTDLFVCFGPDEVLQKKEANMSER